MREFPSTRRRFPFHRDALLGVEAPLLWLFVMRLFLDNLIRLYLVGGCPNVNWVQALFRPDLPVGQWDQQVFLGRFLLFLADRLVLLF